MSLIALEEAVKPTVVSRFALRPTFPPRIKGIGTPITAANQLPRSTEARALREPVMSRLYSNRSRGLSRTKSRIDLIGLSRKGIRNEELSVKPSWEDVPGVSWGAVGPEGIGLFRFTNE